MKPNLLCILIIKFSAPLTPEQYYELLGLLFRAEPAGYDLWGSPIELGSTKHHTYGSERVSWTPANFETTEKGIVIMSRDPGVAQRLAKKIKARFDPGAELQEAEHDGT